MDMVMDRIQYLSDERQQLWRKAGHGQLTDKEYWRLQQITRELTQLWDDYRRQHAAVAWNGDRHRDGLEARNGEPLMRAA